MSLRLLGALLSGLLLAACGGQKGSRPNVVLVLVDQLRQDAADTWMSETRMATLSVKVVPGAKRDEITGRLGDAIKVRVSAAPENGKANAACASVLAAALGVKLSQIRLVRGQTQPRKVFEIEGLTQADLDARVGGLCG